MDDPTRDLEPVAEHWEDVVADMEATAAEYRDDDWDVVELHPGDVTPLGPDAPGGRWGLDVLIPDDEFADVERLLADGARFDACEVLRATGDGFVFAVVVMLAELRRTAVVFPVYYHPDDAEGTFESARTAGKMRTHLRPLSAEQVVTFEQGDPSLFAPE